MVSKIDWCGVGYGNPQWRYYFNTKEQNMNIIIVTDKETDKIDCMCIDIRTTGIKTVDISYNINEY